MNTYLFDFDGTLVDSMPTYASVMLRILDENGIEYEKDIVKIITPLGLIDTAKYFIKLGVKKSFDEILGCMMRYSAEAYANTVEAKPYVVEVLKELKRRGDDLNVLTASPHENLDVCLKRVGIYDLFTNVWSCNDFGTNKADPKIYHMAAEKIGKDVGEIIFLDDNYNADLTAKSAGMIVYGVYDDSSSDYAEEMKKITDKYIIDFRELL